MLTPILPPHKTRSASSWERQWGSLASSCSPIESKPGWVRAQYPTPSTSAPTTGGVQKREVRTQSSQPAIHPNMKSVSRRPFWCPIIHSVIRHLQELLRSIPGTVLGSWEIPNAIFHPLQSLQSASRGTGGPSVGERDEAWGVREPQVHCWRGCRTLQPFWKGISQNLENPEML